MANSRVWVGNAQGELEGSLLPESKEILKKQNDGVSQSNTGAK